MTIDIGLSYLCWLWLQNSRAPGTSVHGIRKDALSTGPLHGGVTIGRLMAGVDYNRQLRPKWSGTAGINFQVSLGYFDFPIWFVSFWTTTIPSNFCEAIDKNWDLFFLSFSGQELEMNMGQWRWLICTVALSHSGWSLFHQESLLGRLYWGDPSLFTKTKV